MIYLAHRGYWLLPEEKNSQVAFDRAWNAKFGVETDLRDSDGRVVVSHDIPYGGEIYFDDFLREYHVQNKNTWLALNIKSDGLGSLIKELLERYAVKRYFVFDMAVPEMLAYLRLGCPVATRMSEFEIEPSLWDQATHVWVDSFERRWFNNDLIFKILDAGKVVSIVSPELHGRLHLETWNALKDWGVHKYQSVMLCTDYPKDAKDFFDE